MCSSKSNVIAASGACSASRADVVLTHSELGYAQTDVGVGLEAEGREKNCSLSIIRCGAVCTNGRKAQSCAQAAMENLPKRHANLELDQIIDDSFSELGSLRAFANIFALAQQDVQMLA